MMIRILAEPTKLRDLNRERDGIRWVYSSGAHGVTHHGLAAPPQKGERYDDWCVGTGEVPMAARAMIAKAARECTEGWLWTSIDVDTDGYLGLAPDETEAILTAILRRYDDTASGAMRVLLDSSDIDPATIRRAEAHKDPHVKGVWLLIGSGAHAFRAVVYTHTCDFEMDEG